MKAIPLIFLFLFPPVSLHSSGKIKGKIVDKATAEHLIGANVLVEGTSYGAATDNQGEYSIVNVPVGVYRLKVSYVGYTTMTIENVRVFYELTTEIHVELSSEEIVMEGISVTAQRPLVNKSSTNAVRIATSTDIQNTPVRGIDQILALQPGVVLQDGTVYVRGGRGDEVGFYLEGASITDPQYGGRGLTIVQEALEEISVQSGGYESEFGRSNAGIIQHQLKTGGEIWRGTIEYVTDNIALSKRASRQNGKKRLGAYWYGYNEFTATLGGPLLDERFRLFGLFNYDYEGDGAKQPLKGIDIGPVKDPFAGDSISLVYPAGAILKSESERITSTGTFTMDFSPLHFRISGSLAKTTASVGAGPWDLLHLDRIPQTTTWDGFGSLKGTYFFNPTTFVELSGGFFMFFLKRADPVLLDNYMAYGDSAANAEAGYVWSRSGYETTGRYVIPAFRSIYGWIFAPSNVYTGDYLKLRRDNISLNASFSAQLGRDHSLKLGGDYQWYTIRTFQLGSPNGLADRVDRNNKLPDGDPQKLSREQIFVSLGVNNYGYDVFGKKTNRGGFLGPRHPVFASAYLQDKMELGDLVVNAGLRYDYISTNSFALVDPTRPELTIDRATLAINQAGLRKASPFQSLSPRFGASFSLTDRTVFHVQFAKLVQQSRLRDLNLGLYSVAQAMLAGGSSQPIGFDLRPTRTTQYEIGFSQQIKDFASFDLTVYYKDIRDEVVMRLLEPAQGSPFTPYSVFANGDFATTKGAEIAFAMRRQSRIQVSANVSFQDAQGSGSYPNANRGIILSSLDTTFTPYYISPLSFNNSVRGSIGVDYRFGVNDGGPILEELGASLLFTFNSGHPYTKVQPGSDESFFALRYPAESLNSSTTPWVSQIDLRIDKTIRLTEQLKAVVYLFVINLFDAKNVINVHVVTGSAEDDGWLSDPALGGQYVQSYGPLFEEIYRAMSQYQRPIGTAVNVDPFFYGPPRQIRFGVRLEY